MFNLGVWKNYLASSVNGNPYNISALLLTLFLLWYIYRRGIIIGIAFLKKDFVIIAQSLFFLAIILIPAGLHLGFLKINPKLNGALFLQTLFGYIFFVGIPEELVFRGMLQNILNRMATMPIAVLISNSLFACIYTHLTGNSIFPNWTYVGFAFIAGLVYAISYIKSGSIFVPILVHGITDTLWRIFLS